jgi:hypothetical protein
MFIKEISRIGCQKGKYLIFDSSAQHYLPEEHQVVVLLPWRGDPKNTKLIAALNLLLPILRGGRDLSEEIKEVRPKLDSFLKPMEKWVRENSQTSNKDGDV